jgi:uncharacterized protein
MAIKIGPSVTGDDFFGRLRELELAVEEIFAGNHLSINAPRRVGKSSFVLRLKHLLNEKHQWEGIYFDMSGAESEIDFAKRMIAALKENKSKLIRNVLDALDGLELSIGGMVKYKKEAKAEKTAEDILIDLGNIINKIEGDFLIAIDELPIFLQHLIKQDDGLQRANNFLYLLRSYRANQKNHPKNNTVWVFCGSIGLEYFTEKHGLAGGINELKPFDEIGAFSREESASFLNKLAKREKIALHHTQVQYMIEKTGWTIPFFLAILFEGAKSLCNEKKEINSNEIIDEGYFKGLEKFKNKLETWYSRLNEQLEVTEKPIALKILDAVVMDKNGVGYNILLQKCFKSTGEEQRELLNVLLQLLVHDGYFVKQNNKYHFRSPFLRDWWMNRRNLNL